MDRTYDLAVVGSGFAGSLLAMIARRLGHDVVLLERSRHPRFAVGESSTPLANLLLEELASRYDLPGVRDLAKWGSWQRTHPEIACGLKRGFSFYHHGFDRPFTANPDRTDQLLVAASPHEGIADTHWYRPEFDQFLVAEARDAGVAYLDEVVLGAPTWLGDRVVLSGSRRGTPASVQARFVVDATGPRGFLHRALHLPEVSFPSLPATQGLYAHLAGVRRLADLLPNPVEETPPYPVDDAAVHHVFDGGWIWILHFNNGVTSAGVAVVDALADTLRLYEGAPAWQRLLQRLPTVAAQCAGAAQRTPFVYAPRLSFCSGAVVGKQWALLPSAAGFTDPLLSTGFSLALLGVLRLAACFEQGAEGAAFEERLHTYAAQTRQELFAAERLIGALYANMDDFEVFTALTLLYFAAASFTETAWRLGRPEIAGGFLLHDHPHFGPQSRSCLERAMQRPARAERTQLIRQIHRTIKPFDVAGLGRRDRRNWYPVDAGDLLRAAGKLEASRQEVEALLRRSGFVAERPA